MNERQATAFASPITTWEDYTDNPDPFARVLDVLDGRLVSILTTNYCKDTFDGQPLWQASLVYYRDGEPVPIADLPRMVKARLEAEARSLLRGVGAGEPEWKGVHRRPEQLNVRRRLSDEEQAQVPLCRTPEPITIAAPGPRTRR